MYLNLQKALFALKHLYRRQLFYAADYRCGHSRTSADQYAYQEI